MAELKIQQLYEQGYIGGGQSGETCYYYHYDGLGSVVALSNSSGNTIQTYEYSVYGQVAASDPNLTNPFMFTGRRFDFETGLYYYRARYYNPYIGRFLQTDPVGYGYAYCSNNPLSYIDPFGLLETGAVIPTDAISDKPNMYNPGEDIKWWLIDIRFSDWYPEWEVIKVEIVSGSYAITFGSRAGWDPADIEVPDFQTFDWNMKDAGEDISTIPIERLSVPKRAKLEWAYVAILTDRQLEDIIKHTIHRINEWSHKGLGFTHALTCDICKSQLWSWDSPFHTAPPELNTWKYSGTMYDNSSINYMAGGYGMAYMGFNWTETKLAAWYYKTRVRTPPSRFTEAEKYWILRGWEFYNYDVGSHW
jgi:RHS repeat-associated protein